MESTIATTQTAAHPNSAAMVGTSRCDVPARVSAGGTCPPKLAIGLSVPSPDAALGDGDGASRRPYHAEPLHGRMPPVIRSAQAPRRNLRVRAGYAVLALMLGLPTLCAVGIAGYFRLSSATKALGTSVMDSVPGQWDKRFAVHVGGLSLGLVRWGSSFFDLPPEAKAALEAVHGAEVGVYKLEDSPSTLDYSAVFTSADKSMRRRGWERMVGVAQRGQFVAVYVPRHLDTLKRMACCVVVLNEQNLVVASARGNVASLLDLAMQHLPERDLPSGDFTRR